MAPIAPDSPADPRFVRGHLYVRPPRPLDFPALDSPDQQPPETKRCFDTRTALSFVLEEAFAAGATIGSAQLIYWNPTSPLHPLAPAVFVKLGFPDAPFAVWKTWERGAPELAVELVSPSSSAAWDEKLDHYRAAGILEVVRVDLEEPHHPIRIWDHLGGDLVERAPEDRDLLACQTLALWWSITTDTAHGPTLRLAHDREARHLLPTPSEVHAQAERARLQAEQARYEAALLVAQTALASERVQRDVLAAELDRLKAELAKNAGG